MFNFLDGLNKNIEAITFKSNKVSLLTDEIRISAVSILKYQRRVLQRKSTPELIERLITLCESLSSQLTHLDSFYNDDEVKKVVVQMLAYIDSLKIALNNGAQFQLRGGENVIGLSTIGELADKILDAFSDFQEIQYAQSRHRDDKIKAIINETKRNMMTTLIIGFLGTIVLALMVPGKIALPFKKIRDAIRELQECNFDVSIYYNQDDEIGEIAKEMNKMIASFKVFDELRTDRIGVENRKFDALANLIKKPVLVADADGKLIYINSNLYQLMQVQTEDVLGKKMTDTVIPASIQASYDLAIKRRSKIENAEIKIFKRKVIDKESSDRLVEKAIDKAEAEIKDLALENGEEAPEREAEESIFEGYANVLPIRGKESSLDYYLMVLSSELFT